MSLFTLLATLVRELAPFLKEALLEGQTFRAWFRYNWLTFAWLVNTLALTLMIAYLSDHLTIARTQATVAVRQLQEMQEPATRLVEYSKKMKQRNAQLELANSNLLIANTAQAEELKRFKDFHEECGLDIQSGQCPVKYKPVSVKPKPKRPKTTPTVQEPQVEEEPGFWQRLRDKLKREKGTT